jgi:hypothetical protein
MNQSVGDARKAGPSNGAIPDLIRVGSDPLFRPLRANPHFLVLLDRLKAASRTLDGR